MKVFVVFFACLVASAYSRRIVIKYVTADEGVQQPAEDPSSLQPVPVSGDEGSKVIQPKREGSFFSSVFSEAGNLAADTADTAGRIAKGVVEVPATLVSKTFSEAGKGAAEALRETGREAAKAVEHVERGIDNIFGSWDK